MKRIALLFTLLLAACTDGPATNPDPNHTHADVAVYVNGQRLDFSHEQYMSEAPVDPIVFRVPGIQVANAHLDEPPGGSGAAVVNEKRKYLHLHDGNGRVIHRHKPGLTLGQFFDSIGFSMSGSCLTLDDLQYAALDAGGKESFGITKQLCDNGKFRWTMVVNGTPQTFDPAYEFKDLDRILLSYGASDTAWQEEWETVSNDACLYSRTCPERGEPPTENCIADPEVPCVVPEE